MKMDHHADIFPWNESFSTGIYEIDQQHKKLIDILNNIAGYIALQSNEVDFNILINELVDYAVYHFDTEDKFWLDVIHDTPQTKLHRESHNQFVKKINALKADIDFQTEEQWIEDLLSFLASWLASHILESDRHMALIVEAMQAGKSLDEAEVWADEQLHATAKVTIDVVLTAYRCLAANTIRLMREIKSGTIILNKLSESEQNLQQALDYAQIAHWSFPYKGKSATWSPQMYHILGLSEDVTASPEVLCNIMKSEYQQSFLAAIKRCFETGEEHHIEYQIIRPNDGEVRWIECRGKVHYNGDGTPAKMSGFVQDITERKEYEQRITQLAYYDPLTLLPNRRLLLDRLNQSIVMSDRHAFFNALLFIDIDNFKTVNDSHGHEYGDSLLKQASARIQKCIRKGDTLARIGGDEFIIILSEMGINEVEASMKAEIVTQKVLNVLSLPYTINKHQFESSASIGIILFNDSSVSASELLKRADISMYQAKKSGKGSICFYDPQMHKEITTRLNLENELKTALKEQQFELYYQPQVDYQNGVTGAEVLIRWIHPVKGLIYPDDFIPIAEDSGLIILIGEWVLKEACKQLRRWKENVSTDHLTLSVNVSYKQFREPNFVSLVNNLVKDYGVTPGKLKLELTESIFVDKMELTVAQVEALEKLGVQLSLDDFGTGYSSLQYLRRLPLSQLKIDRSFVDELETNLNDQSIVKTIILMASSLGMDIIAEGVETFEQRNYLANNGCNLYQGYFFSKPIPINEFEKYLMSTIN